jgi:hypothetical protein
LGFDDGLKGGFAMPLTHTFTPFPEVSRLYRWLACRIVSPMTSSPS